MKYGALEAELHLTRRYQKRLLRPRHRALAWASAPAEDQPEPVGVGDLDDAGFNSNCAMSTAPSSHWAKSPASFGITGRLSC